MWCVRAVFVCAARAGAAERNTQVLYIYRSKSGIYHFLINLSSGMGEWYMKVVYDSFDSWGLLQFD